MHPSPTNTESALGRALLASVDARRGEVADPLTGALPQLAVLLLLRWIDLGDAEQEAIALFNDEDYERALAGKLTWDSWAHLRGAALAHHIREMLLPGLLAVRPGAFPVDLSHPTIAEALLSPAPLDELLQAVAGLPFETVADQRRVGETFGELVRATIAKARHAGTFATPLGVAKLMAHLAAPRPGDRIFDPCFGSAEVLVQCIDHLHAAQDFHTGMQWERIQAESVFGVEIAPAIHLIGLVRVLLAGTQHPGLVLGDALRRPVENGHAQRFDVVVAVPPWGRLSRSELDSQDPFPIKTRTLEGTFVQLAMAALRPGGRAVLAVPDGLLFRSGAERNIRQWLLEQHQVEAVVQLPSGSFRPYTGIRISLLVLTKGGSTERVRFVDLSMLGSELELSHDLDQVLARTGGDDATEAVRVIPATELAKREWRLIAPSLAEAEFDELIEELGQLNAVRIASLGEVASLSNGMHHSRAESTDDAKDPMATRGLIRVRDVGEHKLRPPSFFAHAELAERAKEGQVLRSGDLVVAVSFRIGRVGIVSNGSIGCIAAKGIAVIRPNKNVVSARYLAAVLRSPLSQDLLGSLARDLSSRHLPFSALKALRIPIPPLPVQERIAEALEHQGGDAFALLRITLTEDTHPVVTYLQTAPAALAVRNSRNAIAHGQPTTKTEDPLVILRLFGKGLQQAIDEKEDRPSLLYDKEVSQWAHSLNGIAEGMAGLATDDVDYEAIPLQVSIRAGVSTALKTASQSLPQDLLAHEDGLVRTLDAARYLLDHATQALTHDVGIEASQASSEEEAYYLKSSGTDREVTLVLTNSGLAPLLQFEAELHIPPDEVARFDSKALLLGDQSVAYRVELPDPTPDICFATLYWKATTLNLEPVSGEQSVIFMPLAHTNQPEATEIEPEIGASPYILGNPVDRKEMFFGRKDVLDQMRQHLGREGVANVILLEGNRRTGKTSILKSLQWPDTLPSHVPVYCSFQASAGHESKLGVPTSEVFRTIGRSLVKDCTLAGFPLPIPGTPDDLDEWADKKRRGFVHMKQPQLVNAWFRDQNALSALESLVQVAIDAVAPRRLLLMLDEFDKLQEGIDSGVTSPQVPENIRYLFQNYTAMAGVLTGSRRIRRLREEYWNALFGFGLPISVTSLPEDAAAELVQKPVTDRLSYHPDAVEHILGLCACQPFLIQLLCAMVFNHAAADDVRHVSKKLVDAAAGDLIRDNEHFRTLWGYAGSERARYILQLCHELQDGPDPVTFDLLQNKLELARVGYPDGDGYGVGFNDDSGRGSGYGGGYGFGLPGGSGWGDGRGPDGIIVSADSLRNDLDHLRELELISQVPDGRYHVYRLTVPLMGLWIVRNIDARELLKLAVQEGRQER